jgi:predicted secreted protein
MATPMTGLNGTVEIEGTVVASMRSWELTLSTDPQEVGGFGSKWERQAPGRMSGEGSFEGIAAYGDAGGQGAVQAAFTNNTLVTLTLGEDATREHVVEAYITELTFGAEYDGVTNFSASYVLDGEPTSLASRA